MDKKKSKNIIFLNGLANLLDLKLLESDKKMLNVNKKGHILGSYDAII